jgi:hypothetical protein
VRGALRRLRAHERRLRRALDPEHSVAASRALGADPYRLCPREGYLLGVLRGSSEVVLLDSDFKELSRLPAPVEASDCALDAEGDWLVLGREGRSIARYVQVAERLEQRDSWSLATMTAPRAFVVRGDHVLVADEVEGTLASYELVSGQPARLLASTPLCRHPIALQLVGTALLANCLLEHAIVVRELTPTFVGGESARIVHDGPFWGFSGLARDGALLIAATGVEDRPLERFGGAFGYVDSFVFLYRVRAHDVKRLAAVDTSDLGLLVPKAVLFGADGEQQPTLTLAAYGSDQLLRCRVTDDGKLTAPALRAFAPGIQSLVEVDGVLFAASPLLDAWARLDGETVSLATVRSRSGEPSPGVRLGEALVMSGAIAPLAKSEGKNSRFTCETCHFEGGVDGRVHDTGRGNVRVTTRPLVGLLRNAPHFSRALDRDLTSVSHNEFRVAGLGNDYDPWFSLDGTKFPWLEPLGAGAELGPEALRRAVIDFLARFEPDPNPRALGRTAFDARERDGAQLFRERCAACHAARLASDQAESEVPFERWESLILSRQGPLVWARGEYEKTGILPYVHARGARIPSLRRVSLKFPYFTNGSAASLAAVLEGARFAGPGFYHAPAPAPANAEALNEAQRGALEAFLLLL